MTREDISAMAAVLILPAACLLAGCVNMRVGVRLSDDGTVAAAGMLRSPLIGPELFSVTNNPKVKAFAEEGGWKVRAVKDGRGWHGVALAKRFSCMGDVHLAKTNAPGEDVPRLALRRVENDIYELRLDLDDDASTRFIGEAVPGRTAPPAAGLDLGKLLASDLMVLLLRGVEFGCTFQVPGEVVGTTLERIGPRKAAVGFRGDDIIREYFGRTEDVAEERRSEILAAIMAEQMAPATNAWIRFRWPNGANVVADAERSGSRGRREPRRTVLLTAPPPCVALTARELGSVRIARTTVKTSREAGDSRLKHELEWHLRMTAEDELGKRYKPLRIDREKLAPPVTSPEAISTKSELRASLSLRGMKGCRFSFRAGCAFTGDRLPALVRELDGSARVLLADRPAGVHALTPGEKGVYALQWGKDGTPRLDFIEKRGDALILYCHGSTSSFLSEHKDWKMRPNPTDRIVELTWQPWKKVQKPVLRLRATLYTCDYSFCLRDVPVP